MRLITLILLAAIIITSCKKDSFITSPQALFRVSADTLTFDTVFTTAGSITKSFKILNPNTQKLRLSKVKLMGGSTLAYKMNVDGTPTTEINNVDIAGNDSLYVFVQVNINPNAVGLPFIVRDSILINYNGNNRYVQLQAYGQNAVFLQNQKITGNVTWTNTLPYVILNKLTIDTTATLNISTGTKVYFHADAPMLVDGKLLVNGTKANPVIFRGDRLDPEYKDLPAGWPGIYFRTTSKDNVIKFAQIRNAYQAIVVQDAPITANPKLRISQSIIDNAYDAGIYGIATSIYADNCLISNCGRNILLILGGDHQFVHCTVASYSNFFINHTNPVMQLTNYASQGGQTFVANLTAVFRNCIFWGEGGVVEDEIIAAKQGTTAYNVTFDHILYKAVHDPLGTIIASIKNQPPTFDSINTSKNYFDFHFNKNPGAPAINKGILTLFPLDLDDKPRANGPPDLGAYER